MNNLRTMMDDLKNKLESAVVVLASVNDDDSKHLSWRNERFN